MFTRKPLVTAVTAALLSATASYALADDTIQVTGIRASQQKSIATKKNALTNVEVVSAEDVGKMPDKNIADSLSRLAGVNVTHGAAFAFDEAERVQVRGTPTFLNLVTVNGHSLSSGDWYLSDQSATTRAVGFGMLPSQLIGEAVVYKNGRADITEGGVGGTIDVITRKPLALTKNFVAEAAVGAAYTTLAGKTDPQLSALVGWKNEANTFGILAQAFKEDRRLRRDQVESNGNSTLIGQDAANPAKCFTYNGSQLCGDASLKGKRLVANPASAIFEGERQRKGAFVSAQFRPNTSFDASVTAFHSSLSAANKIANVFPMGGNMLNNGALLTNVVIDPAYDGDVIKSYTLVPSPNAINANNKYGAQSFQISNQVRTNAGSTSAFYDFDFKYSPIDNLSIDGKIGRTVGTGETKEVPGLLLRAYQTGYSFSANGDDPWNWAPIGVDLSKPTQGFYMSYTGQIQGIFKTHDEDNYVYLNGEYNLDKGWLTRTRFGVRGSQHENRKDAIQGAWNYVTTGSGGQPAGTVSQAQDSVNAQYPVSSWPLGNLGGFPGNFAEGLEGNFPHQMPVMDEAALVAFGNGAFNWDPVLNKNWGGSYVLKERNRAAYISQEFEIDNLSGVLGLRYVSTKEDITKYINANTGGKTRGCAALAVGCVVNTPTDGVITSSRIGAYLPQNSTASHTNLLPSLNLRLDMARNVIARASAATTMARPEYSQLASPIGGFNINVNPKTASGGNPNLKPITAKNLDASVAWHFAPRGYVQTSIFQQKMSNYIKTGASYVRVENPDAPGNTPEEKTSDYLVSSFVGKTAKLRGFEFNSELPIGNGFGVIANTTYVDGEDEDHLPMINTSKWTYNLRGYYENEGFSASLAWNHRTEYAIGFVGNGTATGPSTTAARNGQSFAEAQGSLSASVSYKINPNLSVSLDGNNLLNPRRYYYQITPNMPIGWYKNGSQYYLNLRAKY